MTLVHSIHLPLQSCLKAFSGSIADLLYMVLFKTWNGIELSDMDCYGMEYNGKDWNGIEWNYMYIMSSWTEHTFLSIDLRNYLVQ